MTADLELDLEERLALLHGGRGRADGCRQVRVALSLLLSQPGPLGAIGLCACFLSLALAPFCLPLLSTLEHRVLRSASSVRIVLRPWSRYQTFPDPNRAAAGRLPADRSYDCLREHSADH